VPKSRDRRCAQQDLPGGRRADYCGRQQKTIFTVGNYLLPKAGACRCTLANVGSNNDAAILFGLSGTGKTRCPPTPSARLIGDDETIWSDNGRANLEDGCYAKLINWTRSERSSPPPCPSPAHHRKRAALRQEDGRVPPGRARSERRSMAENTRFTYRWTPTPTYAQRPGPASAAIVLLTRRRFGVLPPSRPEPKDVMYHFVSRLHRSRRRTEVGVTEPQPPLGLLRAPFMAHKPNVYPTAGQKMEKHKARCILLNTGWSGRPARRRQAHVDQATRALLNGRR